MERYYKYHFEVIHDYGRFFKTVISYSKKSAYHLMMEAENCPKRAINFIRKELTTI